MPAEGSGRAAAAAGVEFEKDPETAFSPVQSPIRDSWRTIPDSPESSSPSVFHLSKHRIVLLHHALVYHCSPLPGDVKGVPKVPKLHVQDVRVTQDQGCLS